MKYILNYVHNQAILIEHRSLFDYHDNSRVHFYCFSRRFYFWAGPLDGRYLLDRNNAGTGSVAYSTERGTS